MPDWAEITRQLGVQNDMPTPVSGGDISAAWRLGKYFLKTGPLAYLDMYSAEAEGLGALAATNTVRVPSVIGFGEVGEASFIALQWLDLTSADAATEAIFGEQLASLHRCSNERYGWHRDNPIGLTPQPNAWSDDWVAFLRERRLGNQLRRAAGNGFTGELQQKGARLLKRLPYFFDESSCVPSLLHGDLWGGNWAASGGEPVMFDPVAKIDSRIE
ncbi:MAG: fructosamine kinase family protein, partial [Pseudomonadota bacterium]